MPPAMKIVLGLMTGLMAGFLMGWIAHPPPAELPIETHWQMVLSNIAYFNQRTNYGAGGASDPYDRQLDTSLAALVTAGELEHLDLVLPSVPYSPEATKLWMRFCHDNTNIIEARGEYPPSSKFKRSGTPLLHLNIWYRKPAERAIQNLIDDLEQMSKKPSPQAFGVPSQFSEMM